jgi:starvation-inducible DNA-binding protein
LVKRSQLKKRKKKMQNKNKIEAKLNTLFCDNFIVYYKSHGYHFNVEGPTFVQDHDLLNEIYDFLWEQHDVFGEQLRQMSCAAPTSLKSILTAGTVSECNKLGESSKTMFTELSEDFEALMRSAQDLYDEADMESCGGLATMLGDYLKALSKLHWKLKATIGKSFK